jgi:hypothetical protein
VVAAAARANTLSTTVVVPYTSTSWFTSVSFAKWDPLNGALNSITFSITAEVQGTMMLENTGPNPIVLNSTFAADAWIVRPDMTLTNFAMPAQTFVDALTGFDGTADFAGSSGVTHAGILATDTANTTTPPPASDLVLFTGSPGNPGTITLPAFAQNNSTVAGHTLVRMSQTVRATITLTYDYTPWPISAFCFGDGFGTLCPCGNSGSTGNGCSTSFNPAGARLAGMGMPSVQNDSFTLVSLGTASAPILFFQGTLQQNGGLGSVFGDGLVCASGVLMRLGITFSSAGLAQYPFGGAPQISIQGGIPTGGNVTRYYQAMLRDSTSFCGPATFNLTNALAVPWLP